MQTPCLPSASSKLISGLVSSKITCLFLSPKYPKKAVQSINNMHVKNHVNEATEHLSNPKIEGLVGDPFPRLAKVSKTVATSIKVIYLQLSQKIENKDLGLTFLVYSKRY